MVTCFSMSKTDPLQQLMDAYELLVGGIDKKAVHGEEGRAYGGIIRAEN